MCIFLNIPHKKIVWIFLYCIVAFTFFNSVCCSVCSLPQFSLWISELFFIPSNPGWCCYCCCGCCCCCWWWCWCIIILVLMQQCSIHVDISKNDDKKPKHSWWWWCVRIELSIPSIMQSPYRIFSGKQMMWVVEMPCERPLNMDAIDENVNIADIFRLTHLICHHGRYYLVLHRADRPENPVEWPPFDYVPNYPSTAVYQLMNYHC